MRQCQSKRLFPHFYRLNSHLKVFGLSQPFQASNLLRNIPRLNITGADWFFICLLLFRFDHAGHDKTDQRRKCANKTKQTATDHKKVNKIGITPPIKRL